MAQTRQTTNCDGLAAFSTEKVADGDANLFVSAADTTQAFAAGYATGTTSGETWRIYAFTDRPAYRPKETVQWKFIARRMNSGVYSTPADQLVEYEIHDPRGTKVSEGKATLNTFGSAWGSLELSEQLPLGQYNIQFWDQGRNTGIGSAALFRLEEYKLPEFKVAVKTPEQDGKKKAFRLGEKVEVNIQADYSSGAVQSSVKWSFTKRFYHYWSKS